MLRANNRSAINAHTRQVSDTLQSVLDTQESSDVDIDNKSAERRSSNALLIAAFDCLAAIWPDSQRGQSLSQQQAESQARHLSWVLESCLGSVVGRDPAVRVAALNCLHR
jgi:hypothetical protein